MLYITARNVQQWVGGWMGVQHFTSMTVKWQKSLDWFNLGVKIVILS